MVKMTRSGQDLDFGGHLSSFRGANTRKNRSCKTKNNPYIILKQPQSKFEKVQKTTIFTPKNVKMGENCHVTKIKISPYNISFRGHEMVF